MSRVFVNTHLSVLQFPSSRCMSHCFPSQCTQESRTHALSPCAPLPTTFWLKIAKSHRTLSSFGRVLSKRCPRRLVSFNETCIHLISVVGFATGFPVPVHLQRAGHDCFHGKFQHFRSLFVHGFSSGSLKTDASRHSCIVELRFLDSPLLLFLSLTCF